MSSDDDTNNDDLDKGIDDAIKDIAQRVTKELYALSDIELANQWFFQWNDNASVSWNIYLFNETLALHKNRCRRWEEHHHGSMCVVERVRDKYLMPRIREFVAELANRIENTEAKLSAERLAMIDAVIHGKTPSERFDRHTGVSTYDNLRQWAERQLRETLMLRSRREDGAVPPDDDLENYFIGKQAVLTQLLANMRQIAERGDEP